MDRMGDGFFPACKWSWCCLCRILCWLLYLDPFLGWVARTVWMPWELKWISELSAPTAFRSLRCPHSSRQSPPSTDRAGHWGRHGCWTLVDLLVVLVSVMVVMFQTQPDVGGLCFWVHHPLFEGLEKAFSPWFTSGRWKSLHSQHSVY